MFIKADELLRRAAPLYAVADGRKTRTMIDAVRDAMPDLNSNYDSWSMALDSLTEATNSSHMLGGFQAWERQDGRTIEECREAFQRAAPIAERRLREKREREMESYCYC